MRVPTDIVIIGGGIMGSSIAHFLSARQNFSGKIIVIEPEPGYQSSSTALSVGGIRQQFSTPENIQISIFGTHFFRHCNDYLQINEPINLSFKENGYLFLASHKGLKDLHKNIKIQHQAGAQTLFLDHSALSQKFPWLSVSDLAGAGFGPEGEGWIDPYSLLQAFKKKALSNGVVYLKNQVIAMKVQHDKVQSVDLANGEQLKPGWVINAAGRRAKQIAQLAGIALPVESRKRLVHVFRCAHSLPDAPLVIDPTGVYFRPEGKQFLCGKSPEPDQDPETDDFDLEFNEFEEVIWPVLANRVNYFEAIRREHTWAGHYAYNILDQNAILGPHPDISNFVFVNGFSGHGLQQAPAVGRGIAELLISGSYQSINLSRFGFDRILNQEPIIETEVV